MSAQAFIADCDAQLAALVPLIEGADDVMRWNISTETRAFFEDLSNQLRRRRNFVDVARLAAKQLEDDGFPEIPNPEAPPGVLEDITKNEETVASVKAIVRPPQPAASLDLQAGTIHDK